jgi:hypothetical protein
MALEIDCRTLTNRVCCDAVCTAWRDRVLTPVTTIQVFLLQILHGNTACRHLPHLSGLRFSAAAYCQARAKLPLRFFDLLLERFGRAVQRSALSASRRSNGRGAAFPWRASWGCSTQAAVCS